MSDITIQTTENQSSGRRRQQSKFYSQTKDNISVSSYTIPTKNADSTLGSIYIINAVGGTQLETNFRRDSQKLLEAFFATFQDDYLKHFTADELTHLFMFRNASVTQAPGGYKYHRLKAEIAAKHGQRKAIKVVDAEGKEKIRNGPAIIQDGSTLETAYLALARLFNYLDDFLLKQATGGMYSQGFSIKRIRINDLLRKLFETCQKMISDNYNSAPEKFNAVRQSTVAYTVKLLDVRNEFEKQCELLRLISAYKSLLEGTDDEKNLKKAEYEKITNLARITGINGFFFWSRFGIADDEIADLYLKPMLQIFKRDARISEIQIQPRNTAEYKLLVARLADSVLIIAPSTDNMYVSMMKRFKFEYLNKKQADIQGTGKIARLGERKITVSW